MTISQHHTTERPADTDTDFLHFKKDSEPVLQESASAPKIGKGAFQAAAASLISKQYIPTEAPRQPAEHSDGVHAAQLDPNQPLFRWDENNPPQPLRDSVSVGMRQEAIRSSEQRRSSIQNTITTLEQQLMQLQTDNPNSFTAEDQETLDFLRRLRESQAAPDQARPQVDEETTGDLEDVYEIPDQTIPNAPADADATIQRLPRI